MNIIFLRCLFLLILSFIFSRKINLFIISLESKKEKGQAISIYLSEEHQKKKNTPTLGGIGIILSLLLTSLFTFNSYLDLYFSMGVLLLCSYFSIGLIDDLLKIILKNYKGLSSLIRILLEILLSLVIYIILTNNYSIDLSIHLNDQIYYYIGIPFIFIFIFIIVGSSNAVNLTDGLDGLSSGVYLIGLLPFSLFLIDVEQINLLYLLLMIYGATLGFISLNLHPARIFMGDSGSLPLGAFLGYISIICKKELLLVIIGGLFVFETLSVIIQVFIYKLTRKRIFKMAPFHHHLEKMGKKEYQIVMIFYIVAFTLSLVGLMIGFLL